MNILACFVIVLGVNGEDNLWKIVGGYDANIKDFPYQISLRRKARHFCGGSIIEKRWILTAAHCVKGKSLSELSAVAGVSNLKENGTVFDFEKLVTHETYNSASSEDDLALLKTSKKIKYDDKIQPVALQRTYVQSGEEVVLTGWGLTAYPNGSIPDQLQYIKLKSIALDECQKVHQKYVVGKNQICTYTKNGEGSCLGDSGGPLVIDKTQVGVVSWGVPCGKGYPDVFMRVSSYVAWIENNID